MSLLGVRSTCRAMPSVCGGEHSFLRLRGAPSVSRGLARPGAALFDGRAGSGCTKSFCPVRLERARVLVFVSHDTVWSGELRCSAGERRIYAQLMGKISVTAGKNLYDRYGCNASLSSPP